MKKVIIAIVVIAVAAATAVGIYFAVGNNNSTNTPVSELVVTKDSMNERISILETMIKNPDRYMKHLVSGYGLSEEKAAEFFAAPENWLTYEQIVVIENTGDTSCTVYGYDIKDNGKNGIYISTSSGGEIGIAPGSSATTSFTILCSDIELSTDDVKAFVDDMEISIIYTNSPTEYADGTLSVEETKTAVITKDAE